MIKKGALFAIAIILFISSCKKERLYFQKVESVESNTAARLNRIEFVNDSLCIIAGGERYNKAVLLRSADAGYTWQADSVFPETNKGQYGLAISADGVIKTCGIDGTTLTSNNGGQAWKESRLGNWNFHGSLSFATSNRIIFVNTGTQREGAIVVADSNQQILKTTEFEFWINDVQMVNSQVGYAAGYGAILKTTDGGDTWNYLEVKNDNFNSLHCLTENDIWACGYNGTIVHSTDGGATWDKVRNGNNMTLPRYHLLDIRFRDANNGYIVGEEGLVIYTNDGGNSWIKYNSFTEKALRSLAFRPDGTLLAVGDEGVIFRLHP